jgi:multiple sugar transport system permease protein
LGAAFVIQEDLNTPQENLESNQVPRIKKGTGIVKSEARAGVLFALPAILGFLIFYAGPMVASLILSFTDYAIVNEIKFIGLHNYKLLFSGNEPLFYKSLGVTFYYVLLSVPLGILFAFFVALLLSQNIAGRAVFRTFFYLPTILPLVAFSIIWLWILNPDVGLLNQLLRLLHLPKGMWLFSEKMVIPSLVMISIWLTGNEMVVFLAGFTEVPTQLYEAIEVDGGNAFQKLWYVTIPMMTPIIFFNLIMGFIKGFQIFTQAYVMTGGGPNNASLVYVYYLYREAFMHSNMGNACALSWILFIIIAIFTVVIFRNSKSWVYYRGE